MNRYPVGRTISTDRLDCLLVLAKVYYDQCTVIQVPTVITCLSIMPLMESWFHLGILSTTSNLILPIPNQNTQFSTTLFIHIYRQFNRIFSPFFRSSSSSPYRDYSRRVYHLVSSAEIKVSWKELIDCGRWIICNKLPLNGVVWYPGGSMKSNRLHHNICCILFHWIPAILIDCLLFCLRYPPVWVTMHEKHIFLFHFSVRLLILPSLLLHLSLSHTLSFTCARATIIGQLIKCRRFSSFQTLPCSATNPKRFRCIRILCQQPMGLWQQQCTLSA